MFADVTSANIVGYSNKSVNTGTLQVLKMLCANFNEVGEEGIHLSEWKVTGYQESSYFQESGNAPVVKVKKLSTGGAITATYDWIDTWDGSAWAGGVWVNEDTDKIIGTGEEADIQLAAGESLWCTIPRAKRTGCTSINLQTSGQVITKSQAFTLNTGTLTVLKGVGNMMAVSVKMSEISVTGYQESSYFQESGNAPIVKLKKLSTGGAVTATYDWIDTWNGSKWVGGYWKNEETDKAIGADDEEDPVLEPGDALWTSTPRAKREGCTGLYLNFPNKVNL